MIVSRQIDEMVQILEECAAKLKTLKDESDQEAAKEEKIRASLVKIEGMAQDIKEAVV